MRIRSIISTKGLIVALSAGALTAGALITPADAAPRALSADGAAHAAAVHVAARSARAVYVTPSSSRYDIKAVQYLLRASGYRIAADGVYGPKTTAAVKSFQKKHKLVVDGKVGPKTLAKLEPTVSNGSSGDRVRAVQEALVKNHQGIAVDGKFGPATLRAVKAVQKAAKVSVDGVVGPVTWSYLLGRTVVSGGGGGTKANCGSVHASVPISHTVYVGHNIRVNKCAAKAVKAMVSAAAKSGVSLYANSSYRSEASQIALRKQNCGTSHYDIWQKPASQCHPPTAIPGYSRHERGLAIDFANAQPGGKVNRWLRAHAASYGFYNLPSEFWHWSTDGR